RKKILGAAPKTKPFRVGYHRRFRPFTTKQRHHPRDEPDHAICTEKTLVPGIPKKSSHLQRHDHEKRNHRRHIRLYGISYCQRWQKIHLLPARLQLLSQRSRYEKKNV